MDIKSNSPIYIFDLDGTLALIEHRRPLLDDVSNRTRWNDFFEACEFDEPNLPVIKTMQILHKSGAQILFFTGRNETVRKKTIGWLKQHTSLPDSCFSDELLMMRPNGDFTPDDSLKEMWLMQMLIQDRDRLVAVFDDRDKVVKMWRKNNVPCFQVAPGNF